GGEGVELLGPAGADVGEAHVRPVARVGLHQPGVLARRQPDAGGDNVGRFPGPQQGAAPQREEAVAGGPLGELMGLFAPGVIERPGLLSLEATLVVVGGLAVAGEVDAGSSRLDAGEHSCARVGAWRAGRAAGDSARPARLSRPEPYLRSARTTSPGGAEN